MTLMTIKIYGKQGCVKCKTTKMQFPNAEYIELPLDSEKIEYFRQQGVRAMPVVEVFDNDELIDKWSDFNYNKIKQYKEAI